MTDERFEKFLQTALERRSETSQADKDAAERVFKRLAGPLPRQKIALWRLPAVLLDWQFAPAWPRVAALAGCAALGFVLGIAGLDRRLENPNAAPAYVGGGGIGTIVFEPDPLTGGRP